MSWANSKLASGEGMSGSKAVNSGEQLCLACGMCCDGSLFDNVGLGANENAAQVKALGLPVKLSRGKHPVAFIRQPCRALHSDCTCEVYESRPDQCRSFECAVFKDAAADRISFEEAHRLVKRAKGKADKVRRLLLKMGETDERLSIGARFRRVQRWVEAGEGDAVAGAYFAELGLAMHKLDLLAHQKFYTEEDAT